jgi:integrase
MTVVKTETGRYKAILKSGREYVGSKTFDRKGDAEDWLNRERAALVGGVDPRAGKQRVRDLLARWLELRRTTVARKTYRTDCDLQRLLPAGFLVREVRTVTDREVARWFEDLLKSGLAEASVVRHRTSLAAFFTWCVREKVVGASPVTGVKVPKSSAEPVEMFPFTEDDLEAAYERWCAVERMNGTKRVRQVRLAGILLTLGWTGLRWGEARAMTVADFVEVPAPSLLVRRSAPEGVSTKATKSGRSRRVPLADRVLPVVRELAESKTGSEFLFTTEGGARLHRTATLRAVDWRTTGAGRRVHDLRHTAACLWLTRGVEVRTVQAWMGHSSLGTTERYLHYLGTAADAAGLARLNSERGVTRGYLPGPHATPAEGSRMPETGL